MTAIRYPARFAGLSLFALALAGCATIPAAPRGELLDSAAAIDATMPPAQSGTTAWNIPIYDIPVDPAVRYGVLDNGMQYAILQNATPKGTASIRFGFDVGFIDESEGEYGLAHFIEHMAFNGSTRVSEGEMVKLLEREGLAFGAETNASTGFEETIYKLDLPRADAELLATGLMLMRETASELTIAPEAVDRERGVILSETRTRNTPQLRQIKDYFGFVAPQTAFAERFPGGGASDIVANASSDDLRALYQRYYRPDNATLVVVGDFDPDLVEAQIRERFAEWQASPRPILETDKGAIAFGRPASADVFVDPGIAYSVTFDRFAPYVDRPDSVTEAKRSFLLQLATGVIGRRLQTIVNSPDSPILSGGASASDFFDIASQSSMKVTAKDGLWREALMVGEQEWRRALEHGFTDAEIAEQIANLQTAYRNAADQAATRRNGALAQGILATAEEKSVFITPQTRLEVFERLKPELTAEAAAAALRAHFTGSGPLIHVASKEPIEGGEATVLAAYRASQEVPVAAPAIVEAGTFDYTDFGAPGTIVSDTRIEDLGIRTIRFANNVRLNLKQTDFEEDKLRYRVRLGSGQLSMPMDEPAVALFMNSMFAAGGLGKHSFDELQRILAGRDVDFGVGAGMDMFQISGTTTMSDLPLQMQVGAAYVTDPGYRTEAQTRWAALIPPFLAQIKSTPQGVAARDLPRIVTNGDLRFGLPSAEILNAVELGELETLLDPVFANAAIEISVVGDIDEAATIDAVAATFGALPERRAEPLPYPDARQVQFAQERDPVTLYHAGAPDQGLATVVWPTTDDGDYREEVTMALLAEILGLQLNEELRENLGATYSPSTSSSMSDDFPGLGTLQAAVVVAPERMEEVFTAIDRIAAQLRTAPIDADLLARARKPMIEKLSQYRRDNGYWLGVLDRAQFESERLDRVRNYESLLTAVTPSDLQTAARAYLLDGERLRVSVLHESLAGQ